VGYVLGMGTAAMDVVLRCEKLPIEDGFSFIHDERLISGGSCANVLTSIVQLGAKSKMLAQVGDDHYGVRFIKELEEAGVDTKHMAVKENGTTLHTFIGVDKNGEKVIFSNLGDSLLTLSESHFDKSILNDVDVFYTDMFPGKPALILAGFCKEQGVKVVFNLQCPPDFMKLCGVDIEDIRDMMKISDIVVLCPEGLSSLSDKENKEEAIKEIYENFNPNHGVISTRGDEGIIWCGADGILKIPALKVVAKDTTGAGDAFNGGFIYSYYYEKDSIYSSLKFANACAAYKCTQLGPRIKGSKEEIEKFFK